MFDLVSNEFFSYITFRFLLKGYFHCLIFESLNYISNFFLLVLQYLYFRFPGHEVGDTDNNSADGHNNNAALLNIKH